MYVFKSKEFIEKLKWLVNKVPNVYYSGSNWSKRNSKGQVQFDCILSIKCLLWNFRNDYKINSRGGTIYKSNGVKDFPCNAIYDVCTNVSKNFNNLIAGEYLCMKDTKYNHSGIYLGNGKVFECTTGWGTRKCIISDISKDGTRSLNGVRNLKWTYHGLLKYIDYSDQNKKDDIASKSVEELANEVLTGKYGNGEARKKALGSRYREVQDRVNQIIAEKNKKERYYVVQKGDTLIGIARKLGIKDWHTLYNNNKNVIGSNPNIIHTGQKLKY